MANIVSLQGPVEIATEPLTSPVATALIAALNAELSAEYPEVGPRVGFTDVPPYGEYRASPGTSVCMSKAL